MFGDGVIDLFTSDSCLFISFSMRDIWVIYCVDCVPEGAFGSKIFIASKLRAQTDLIKAFLRFSCMAALTWLP